ncbi:hypothetical protein RclHR1_05120001 [Rhizophagus clarus]|uniref:Uncharacterized protein n=1 Tax=Rhizophagus clarus TaxID=94130 RepID=A0A2Z6RMK4_9GLOM|nr:hypothetical protein RclHR1_05120001 [Rhizophagus clarus]
MYKTIQCCNGCYLNDKRINKGNRNCYFNKDCLDLNCINRISSCKNILDTKIIKDILEIRHHPKSQHNSKHTPNLIQIYDYDTTLIQNTLSDKESTTQYIALLHHLRSIFNPSDIINIYTDGCFNTELNTLTKHMGTGWVILNNKNEVIVECSSSIKDWSSSTYAELGVILSVMLVLQTGQIANIFTDSQAAIDSINHTRINLANRKNKVRTWLCLKENEDDDYIIYCQQLKDKWLIVANNTMCKSDQIIKDVLLQELPISFAHLLLRNFFPKEKYKEFKDIVKSEKATLTIATIFLEIFINEFYNIIWQSRCKIVAEWEHIKGIKKQDLKKKIPAYQHITYE